MHLLEIINNNIRPARIAGRFAEENSMNYKKYIIQEKKTDRAHYIAVNTRYDAGAVFHFENAGYKICKVNYNYVIMYKLLEG